MIGGGGTGREDAGGYGWQTSELDKRLPWFIEKYEGERKRLAVLAKSEKLSKAKRRDAIAETDIKLTRAVKNDLAANIPYEYDETRNRKSLYRPFIAKEMHYWARLNEMQYQTHRLFVGASNPTLMVSEVPAAKPAQALASDVVPSYDTLEKTECLSRYRYTKSGEWVDNITDWAVAQFVEFYDPPLPPGEEGARAPKACGKVRATSSASASATVDPHPSAPAALPPSPEGRGITKDAIFAYCYAVLHDPLYREKYALNLKREFPRIPFYPDFDVWVKWGEALLKLHIDYEKVKPAKLTRVDTPAPKRAEGTHPKPKLKSNAELGQIQIDEDTQLTRVPLQAWQYRLGNRSAIDWVLDQHKEKTPRDPTIREKFNTYRFADYKESCIELLGRVVAVSVETVAITEAMKAALRE